MSEATTRDKGNHLGYVPIPIFRMVDDEVALTSANTKPCVTLSYYTAFQCMVI
jgi:hypothetical protein